MLGYYDRLEENQFAVILVEETGQEFIVRKEVLPPESSVHSYFDLTIENDKITSIKMNKKQTVSEKQKTEDLMSQIRAKSKGSKFKRK